jgi:hypothetical protein
MPRFPNVQDDEDLFNAITLAGTRSPGKVTITGHDRKVDWDVKAGSGQSGASTTLKAIPPIEFTCAFYLVRDDSQAIDQVTEWASFEDLINSTVNGSTPKALDIYHPDLASRGITSVVLASFGGVIHDGKGGQTVTVKFQEYKPPKPKGGSASGSKAKAAANDPNAAANAELAALTKQYQATPWS